MTKGKQVNKVLGMGLIVLALVFAVIWKLNSLNSIKGSSGSAAEQDEKILGSQKQYEDSLKTVAIDGLKVDPSQAQRPFAVVIENHPDARPQSGLSQADLVYEALAEGGITRYLAVFQTQDVKNIGPVRSARTYFNDWAEELGAIYAHVGGNSDALYYLKNGIPGVSDADQFFNGAYFQRVPPRVPPHNTYTSIAELRALAEHRGFSTQKTYSDYIFKDDAPAGAAADAAKISIDFSEPNFAVKWVYDPATNSYQRYLAGAAVIDAGNHKPVIVKNIIVQRVANWPVATDTPFSISMGTRTGGDAEVYLDGKAIKATWRQVNGRTKYFDLNGNEIALNRGQIWIEIVPPGNEVTP